MKVEAYCRQISEHVTLLGNYYFNSYLIRGNQYSAVIEMGVSATVDLLIAQLNDLEVVPDYLIVTHPHADHITGITGVMGTFPTATVITGVGARQFIEHPKVSRAIVSEDQFISSALYKIGFKPGRPSVESIPDLSKALAIESTYQIDLGDVDVKCFPVYGHAPGNISCYVEMDRVILVSDSLGFHYPGRGVCPLFFTGLKEYMQTLFHFYDLDPLIIGLGHQGPIIGGCYISKILAEASQAAKNLSTFINNYTGTPDELATRLFNRYYVDELTIYSSENISNCMNLLVRRSQEYSQ